MRALTWALGVLGVLAAAYLALAWYCMRRAIRREPRPDLLTQDGPLPAYAGDDPRPMQGLNWLREQAPSLEPMTVKSRDGLTLYADFLPAEGADRTVLLFHGYRSSPYYDFSCIVRPYHEMGAHVLIVHQRAHGKSEGTYIGFGALERRDCADWAWAAYHRFGGQMPLYLQGLSMGASTVMMAADENLPPTVKGIIADCGFTSPRAIIAHTIRRSYHLPPWCILGAMNLWFRLCAHYSMGEASTLRALARSDLPLVIVHGEDDDFVPWRMALESFSASASADKTLVTVPGASHGVAYLKDTQRIWGALTSFFARTMP